MAAKTIGHRSFAYFVCASLVFTLSVTGHAQRVEEARIYLSSRYSPSQASASSTYSLHTIHIKNFGRVDATNVQVILQSEVDRRRYLINDSHKGLKNLYRKVLNPQGVSCHDNNGTIACKIRTLKAGQSIDLHFLVSFHSALVYPPESSLASGVHPGARLLGDSELTGIRFNSPHTPSYFIGFDSWPETSGPLQDTSLKLDMRSSGAKLAISHTLDAELQSHVFYIEEKNEWVLESVLRVRPGSLSDIDSQVLPIMHGLLREDGWKNIRSDPDVYSYHFTKHYLQPPRQWVSANHGSIQLLPFAVRLDSRSYVIVDAPSGMIVDTFPRPQTQESLLRKRLVRQRIPLDSFSFDECPHVNMEVGSTVDEIQNLPGYTFLKPKILALVTMFFGTILGLLSNRIRTLLFRRRKQNVGFGAGLS